jgi:hypothetical protein
VTWQLTEAGVHPWEDDGVIAWVMRRIKAGRTAYQIRDESVAGTHDWPEPGVYLGQNAAEKACAVARDRIRHERGAPAAPKRGKPKASEGGKRVRQLHGDKRAGKRDGESQVFKMQVALAESISYLERFDLPDLEWSEDVQEVLNDIVHDLERQRAWSERAWDTVWALMDDVGRQRRIRELRKRADDPSSEPSERRNARELYEKLERKYRQQKNLGA